MFLHDFLQDLRIGIRILHRERSFCLLAILVLALGICTATTMFSVVNGTMLRGFSFPNAERLAGVMFIDRTQANSRLNGFGSQIFLLDYEAIREQQSSFELIAAYSGGSTVNITFDGQPRRYTGAYVSSDFFRVLGVTPIVGREFTPQENRPGAEKVALISYELWQRDFGGREVVGTHVRLNGKPGIIVGVMPPHFAFPRTEQVWLPLFSEYPPLARSDRHAQVNTAAVFGLLKFGVAFDQAAAEFTGIAAQLAKAWPDTNSKYNTALVRPLIETFTPVGFARLLWTMLTFCIGVLIIACVNVTNMQFARAATRARELAVRSSLGATRSRLIRQLLTESLLIAILGGAVGVALALAATHALNGAAHGMEFPIAAYIEYDIDASVLAFVLLATFASALGAGLIPAWLASRVTPATAMKEGGRGTSGGTVNVVVRALVVLQVGVTSILLVAALLQLQSILRRSRIDWGYDNNAVVCARMALMEGDYPTPGDRVRFFDQLLRELRSDPAFADAALTNRFRMAFSGFCPIEIEGRTYATESDRPNANFEQVSDGYFGTLGVRVVSGRDFTLDDADSRLPVAIVNVAFARKHFGNESPIGRRFRTVGNGGQLFGPWRSIIGVTADIRMLGPFDNTQVDGTGFYLPYFATVFGPALNAPATQQFSTVIVRPRGSGDLGRRAAAAGLALQRVVNKVDPHLPLYYVGTARQNQESFLGFGRIIATLFTVFGIVAQILASIGLYGVVSFSVNRRVQEFGIRMALGADRARILRMVLLQGGYQLLLGLAIGLGCAGSIAAVFRAAIANQLFSVSPLDPATYGFVALLLSAVALLAISWPARRAARVSPMEALRAE
jgi:putative ABC transport system permease protein